MIKYIKESKNRLDYVVIQSMVFLFCSQENKLLKQEGVQRFLYSVIGFERLGCNKEEVVRRVFEGRGNDGSNQRIVKKSREV